MMSSRFMTSSLPSSSLLFLLFLSRGFLPSELLLQLLDLSSEFLHILRLLEDQVPEAEAQYSVEHSVEWNPCHGSPSFLLEAQ